MSFLTDKLVGFSPLRRLSKRAFAAARAFEDKRAVSIKVLGGEVVYNFRVPYHETSTHPPVCSHISVPTDFYQNRRHLFDASPRLTNHDLLSFLLFSKLLDQIQKDTITVAEFGVWRGGFLENLCIRAQETGKKLNIFGFDMFSHFPEPTSSIDLGAQSQETLKRKIKVNAPFSKEVIENRLRQYKSINQLQLIAGDITQYENKQPIVADLVHYDMDYYEPFASALSCVDLTADPWILVDDYYQPTWTGIVKAVNEFSKREHYFPVNISDYFGYERSPRTAWIMLLMKNKGVADFKPT